MSQRAKRRAVLLLVYTASIGRARESLSAVSLLPLYPHLPQPLSKHATTTVITPLALEVVVALKWWWASA